MDLAGFLQRGGVIGFLVLALAAVLLLVTVVVLVSARSRAAVLTVLVLALLPLVVGVVGTGLGFLTVRANAAAHPQTFDESDFEAGRRQALITTWMGGGSTAMLVELASLGLLLRPREQGVRADA